MAITHKYTLMCDEIRQENNGKLIFIGFYHDSMRSNTFPFRLPGLTFFMKLESDRPGQWSFKMRLQHLETGEKLVDAMGALEFKRPGPGFNPMRLPPLQFTAPGTYHFVIEIEGQPEPILYEFIVGLRTEATQS